jgi:hypothetical protein
MQINLLKPTAKFLNGAKLKCLVGKIKLRGLENIKSDVVAIKVPKAGCKVFLVGGDGVSPSAWHHEELDHLKEGAICLKELVAALEEHVGSIMTPVERRLNGLKPVAELAVDVVVVDEVRKVVFLSFTSNEEDIDEHGLVAVRENAGWRLEDGLFVSHYADDAVLPEGTSNVSSIEELVGTWQFDEKATADLLRRKGYPESYIRMCLKISKEEEWVITNTEVLQKSSRFSNKYDLVSVESKKGICLITVTAPGFIAPEVWKLRIINDQMVGVGSVLKKKL